MGQNLQGEGNRNACMSRASGRVKDILHLSSVPIIAPDELWLVATAQRMSFQIIATFC